MEYTVRTWPVFANQAPEDMGPYGSLPEAIDAARKLAEDRDKRYRSVEVIDPFAMVWAQFNMLWEALERAEKTAAHHVCG